MSNPANYSLELPKRCLLLLNELWSQAEATFQQEDPHLEYGPLTSTFLLSMSMPIINLPIERIELLGSDEGQYYVNDRPINSSVAEEIDKVFKGTLKDAPFFVEGNWRFVKQDATTVPNIARGLPEPIADALRDDAAARCAQNMQVKEWRSILRNALAHGGIAYLDEHGKSSPRKPVKMYAFVSGKYERSCENKDKPKICTRNEKPKLTGVRFLRISEPDYRDFLCRWVGWLTTSGIAKASEAA